MKLKTMWLAFAVALMIAVPLRTYQLLYLVDPQTGFAIAGESTFTLLILFLVVFVLLLIVLSALGKHSDFLYLPGRNRIAACVYLATAILTLCDSIYRFAPGGETAKWETALVGVLGLGAAIAFLLLAWGEYSGENPFASYQILALLPTVWIAARLIVTFIHYTTVVNYDISLFDIFTDVFLLLFFHNHSKLLASIEGKRVFEKIYCSGLVGAVFALLTSVPTLAFAAYYEGVTLWSAVPYISDFFLAVLILCFLLLLPARVEEKDGPAIGSGGEEKHSALILGAAVEPERPDGEESEFPVSGGEGRDPADYLTLPLEQFEEYMRFHETQEGKNGKEDA